MLERDYEKFRGGANKPTSERVHVTLSPRGVIAINKNCFALLGKPPAVYLYYSRERDNIAVDIFVAFSDGILRFAYLGFRVQLNPRL